MKFGLALFCLALGVNGYGAIRTFTDLTGRTIRAELIKLDGETVTLRRDDGQVFTLDIKKLSAADQTSLLTKTNSGAPEVRTASACESTERPRIFKLKNLTVVTKGQGVNADVLATICKYHKVKFSNNDFGIKNSVNNIKEEVEQRHKAETQIMESMGLKQKPINWSNEEDFKSKALPEIEAQLFENGPLKMNTIIDGKKRGFVVVGYNDVNKTLTLIERTSEESIAYNVIAVSAGGAIGYEKEDNEVDAAAALAASASVLAQGQSFTDTQKALYKAANLKLELCECNIAASGQDYVKTKELAIKNGLNLLTLAVKNNALVIVPQNNGKDYIVFYFDNKTKSIAAAQSTGGSVSSSVGQWPTEGAGGGLDPPDVKSEFSYSLVPGGGAPSRAGRSASA